MTAHSENFPWTSHYGHYKYFESQMKNHSKVDSLNEISNGFYCLIRKNGTTLRVFICECYAFGVAECMETIERINGVDVIIINSAWCGYTPDAKYHCRNLRIGLFKIGEFMSALHREEYWLHLTEGESEYFRTKGWL